MSEFNLFDTVAVFIILFSAYFAYLRGIVREVMAILSWVASAIAAYLLASQVVPVVKDLPILGEYLAGSCELSVIVAFTLVFAATLIVFSLATLVLTRVAVESGIGIVNQALGMVFGVIRGILIVAVLLILQDAVFSGTQTFPTVSESRSATVFHDLQVRIRSQLPENATERLSMIYGNITAACVDPDPRLPVETPPTSG